MVFSLPKIGLQFKFVKRVLGHYEASEAVNNSIKHMFYCLPNV